MNTEDAPAADETTEEQVPAGIRVLANGTWQDAKTGHFVKAPPPEMRPIRDTETSLAANTIRWEAYRRQFEASILARGDARRSGVQVLADNVIDKLLSADSTANPKQLADATHRVYRWGNIVPSDRPGGRPADDVPHISGRVDHVAAVLAPVMAELARRQAGGAVRDDGNEE